MGVDVQPVVTLDQCYGIEKSATAASICTVALRMQAAQMDSHYEAVLLSDANELDAEK